MVPAPKPSKEPQMSVPRHRTLREVLLLDVAASGAATDGDDLDLSAYEIGDGGA